MQTHRQGPALTRRVVGASLAAVVASGALGLPATAQSDPEAAAISRIEGMLAEQQKRLNAQQ
ncbi:MAG: hypothetical protein ABW128_06410, partial [Rhizorhabdus sp.]